MRGGGSTGAGFLAVATVTVMIAVTQNLYGNDDYDDIDEEWDGREEGR